MNIYFDLKEKIFVIDDFQKRLRRLPTGPDSREKSGIVGKCREMSGNVGDASGGGPPRVGNTPKLGKREVP